MAICKATGRGPSFKDITGKRFGRLVVQAFSEVRKGGSFWVCSCDCGNTKVVKTSDLCSGNTPSCGCIRRKHGCSHNGSRAYRCWVNMRERCRNKTCHAFKDYGGRGIRVCDQWNESFESFLSDMGEPPIGLELDRINNDGDYEPSNCRWATVRQQSNNRRGNVLLTAFGETKTISEWSNDLRAAVSRDAIRDRVSRGLSHEEAISRPSSRSY